MQEHVPLLLKGQIRLGSFEYYRKLEGEEWIVDRSEGIAEFEVDATFDEHSRDANEMRSRFGKLGVVLGHAEGITFQDCKAILEQTGGYLFCCSAEPFEEVRKAMCEDAPTKYRYNACIEIADLNVLMAAIREGKVAETPIKERFSSIECRKVSYNKAPSHFMEANKLEVDPFQKSKKFQAQQEIRILLQSNFECCEPVIIKFEYPEGLLREISIS